MVGASGFELDKSENEVFPSPLAVIAAIVMEPLSAVTNGEDEEGEEFVYSEEEVRSAVESGMMSIRERTY
jgi:hypothetical protein